jgi:hypothetical protein
MAVHELKQPVVTNGGRDPSRALEVLHLGPKGTVKKDGESRGTAEESATRDDVYWRVHRELGNGRDASGNASFERRDSGTADRCGPTEADAAPAPAVHDPSVSAAEQRKIKMTSTHSELLSRHRKVMPSWFSFNYDEPLELVSGEDTAIDVLTKALHDG